MQTMHHCSHRARPYILQIVARVGKLKVLNGSDISANERKECEVQYLREVIGQSTAHQLRPYGLFFLYSG